MYFMDNNINNNNNNNNPIGSLNQTEERLDEIFGGDWVMRTSNVVMTIKAKEGKLSSMSPFLIDESLRDIAGGSLRSVKKLRNGDLMVESENGEQATRLLEADKLGVIPIETVVCVNANTCRGVITSEVLDGVSEEDILVGLKDEPIVNCKRILIRREGKQLPSRSVVLTFASKKLPASVKVGYLNCPVRPYVPNPMRCFKCQRYGHSQASCRSSSMVCARCSESGHESKDCKKEFKCPGCGGPHAAYSRDCETWKKEKKVQTYRVEHGVTYLEARKQMKRPDGAPASYAEKVKAKQTNAEKTKVKEQAEASRVDDIAKFEKAVEESVTKIVNSVINNIMANLVRICGDLLPEMIKNNPMVLLQPPPSPVSETAVSPMVPKTSKRSIAADASPPDSVRPKQGGRGKNHDQQTKKMKPNTRDKVPEFKTPRAGDSDAASPAAEAMEVPEEVTGGMPEGNGDYMERFRGIFQSSKAMRK